MFVEVLFCFFLFGKVRIYQKVELRTLENRELGNHDREQNWTLLPRAGTTGSMVLPGVQNCHQSVTAVCLTVPFFLNESVYSIPVSPLQIRCLRDRKLVCLGHRSLDQRCGI